MNSRDRSLALMDATEWARVPVRWACSFAMAKGPFALVRKLPLRAISHLVKPQIRLQFR